MTTIYTAPGLFLQGSSKDAEVPSYIQKQDLNTQISAIDSEIASINAEIENLRKLRESLDTERKELIQQRDAIGHPARSRINGSGKGKTVANGINYNEEFDWSAPMKTKMKAVFGIENF